MSRMEKKEVKQKNKTFRKIFIVAIFLVLVLFVLKYANNYLMDDIKDKANLIINNYNVTKDLKKDVFVENGIVYIAKEDISNFFDEYIYYDEQYNQIITGSDKKIASIVIGQNKMNDNGTDVEIAGSVLEKNNTYYIPFSELDKIYNVKTTYLEETNTITIDSLNRKFVVADSIKDNSVKYKRTAISRTIDKLEKGEEVVVVTNSDIDGWIKVRTNSGKLRICKRE